MDIKALRICLVLLPALLLNACHSNETNWRPPQGIPGSPYPLPSREAPGMLEGIPTPLASGTNSDTAIVPASPTPDCEDSLTYLEDLNLPDGSTVQPGETLDKQWRVENSGTCNWHLGYRLNLISGEDLTGEPGLTLYPARSGTQAVIHIMITAPQEPGVYRSSWQAFNPLGIPFGDPLYIEFQVQNP